MHLHAYLFTVCGGGFGKVRLFQGEFFVYKENFTVSPFCKGRI